MTPNLLGRTSHNKGRFVRLAIGVAMALAIVATASSPAGAASWGDRAEKVATDYWAARGLSCAPGKVVQVKVKGGLGSDGLTTQGGCLDQEGYVDSVDDTAILMSRHAVRVGWVYFCSLVIHEYGHQLGLHHSHNRKSIMWPVVKGKNLARKAC
jgi:hypothetical protein